MKKIKLLSVPIACALAYSGLLFGDSQEVSLEQNMTNASEQQLLVGSYSNQNGKWKKDKDGTQQVAATTNASDLPDDQKKAHDQLGDKHKKVYTDVLNDNDRQKVADDYNKNNKPPHQSINQILNDDQKKTGQPTNNGSMNGQDMDQKPGNDDDMMNGDSGDMENDDTQQQNATGAKKPNSKSKTKKSKWY